MKKAKAREQLKKLEALAEGNANPYEAQAAREKARELEAILSARRGIFEKRPGSGIFWIRFVDGSGRYRREKVGAFGLAVKLLDKRRGEAVQGKKLPETLRRKFVGFAELCALAEAYIRQKYSRPSDDLARLELLKARLGDRPASEITPPEIERVLDTLARERRWSPSTRNHHHNLVSLAFREGIYHSKAEANPARAVRRKTESKGRIRFLSLEEETNLRAILRGNPVWAEHEAELTLALATGLRRGSMYRDLTWENVDLAGRTLTIPRTKNGEPITLPLNQDAMRALSIFRSRGDGTGRVVRNQAGETLEVNAHWFIPAVRAAGIKYFRWHDCRHTFASRLRQKGEALDRIAALLGHKGLQMTLRYSHLRIDDLHAAVSQINSTLVAPEQTTETRRVAYVQ